MHPGYHLQPQLCLDVERDCITYWLAGLQTRASPWFREERERERERERVSLRKSRWRVTRGQLIPSSASMHVMCKYMCACTHTHTYTHIYSHTKKVKSLKRGERLVR